mgnify:FL=1
MGFMYAAGLNIEWDGMDAGGDGNFSGEAVVCLGTGGTGKRGNLGQQSFETTGLRSTFENGGILRTKIGFVPFESD